MGHIVTLSGPPLRGKSTIAEELLKYKNFRLVVSHTTREPRQKDLPGEYKHMNRSDLLRMRETGAFLWETTVRGFVYGTVKQSVVEALNDEKISVMILVPDVLLKLKKYTDKKIDPKSKSRLFHFYIAVDEEILESRLYHLSAEEIKKRMNDGRDWEKEMKNTGLQYYTIFNNKTPEEAAHIIYCLVKTEDPR